MHRLGLRPIVLAVIRVYLVEDSAILTKLLTGLLEGLAGVAFTGHTDSVREAIEAIAADPPDVVVLDLHLRDGNGFEVLRALRPLGPRPVVIVLTNHAGETYRKAAIDAGARHFFDKGSEIPLMLGVVAAIAKNQDAGR